MEKKLAKFKVKRRKKEVSDVNKNVVNTESPTSAEITNNKVLHENSESPETSSIESLCTKKETLNNINMEPDLIVESSFQFSEGSDDAMHLENANSQLVSLYNQKIESYCSKIRHLEGIITQLTERLASTMSANEAADSAGSQEVKNLKQEINILHNQMREATEMLERQKNESQEILNASGDGKHIHSSNREAVVYHAGVQVEIAELLSQSVESFDEVLSKYSHMPEFTQKLSTFLIQSTSEIELKKIIKSLDPIELIESNLESVESLDEVLLKYSKFPEFSQKLSSFLKQNTTEDELKRIMKLLNPTEKNELFDNLESLDEVLLKYSKLPEFHQKLSAFLKNTTTEAELKHIANELHCLEDPSELADDNPITIHSTLETSTLLKRIEILSVITKLIESLGSASTRTLNESADFSCSKFQSFFLRRLNSNEAEPDVSEAEGDINYAEIAEKSSVRNELPSIERLRSSVVAEDFNLVTDFLLDEMNKMSAPVPCLGGGPRGDVMVDSLETELPDVSAIVDGKDAVYSDYQKFLLQKSKLESRLNNLKNMEQTLQNSQANIHHMSIDADTLTNSEDNILFEEPPLSCISLLSLTDSEYKTESVMTDSELNSRKVSFDMTRPAQDRDLCTKCDRYYELLREKYDDHLCIFKDSLENGLNIEKAEAVKNLGLEIERFKVEKKKLSEESSQQIELLCQEQEMKIQHLRKEYDKYYQESESNWLVEKDNLISQLKNLENELMQSNKKIQDVLKEKEVLAKELEMLKLENSKNLNLEQNRIEAHLKMIAGFKSELAESNKTIQDISKEKEILANELETFKLKSDEFVAKEIKKIESQYISTYEMLKKLHEDELIDLKSSFSKQLQEQELSLRNEHSQAVSLLESSHLSEAATFQKKIEQLLEEKCELLSKTTQEYEAILKKNHKILLLLCNHLRTKLNVQKERILNESQKSANSILEASFSDVLDELNRSIEYGIVKFLNQNYFLTTDDEYNFDDTEYLPLEIRLPVSDKDMPFKKDNEQFHNALQKCNVPEPEKEMSQSLTQLSEGSIELDDFYMIRSEMNKLQEEFQKDTYMYQQMNEELQKECLSLKKHAEELEEHKKKLESQLQEKENELYTKESEMAAINAGSKNSMSGSQLSSSEIRSWQVDAAQTNSRLLHVLSDLVKTFMDIEQDINSHLVEHGLAPSRSGTFTHHDEDTGHSVGSREDFASLSIGDCPNIELVEDGPDLTPRTWDLFAAVGSYDTEIEGEDVVLGASRRLRQAVDHVLNLLTRALNNQQNQDLKLVLKRNEELSHELQEESLIRDAVQMELLTAESTIRKLEGEKQRLEDLNRDLKEDEELLKREVRTEKNKVSQLAHEKEVACDEIQMLKGQCELLASRLGDPEKTGISKMSDSSVTCVREQAELLQENSKLSTEKQSVQKSLSIERQSFRDRFHQMELALEELKAEKEAVVEQMCQEIQDLRAEMDAMEKQLNSYKKFIDEQAQEREQEREEYIREMNKMQEVVREKEKIQSNEAQLSKDIESLEQLLRARIEDHQNAIKKKEAVENELRQSVDKIRDLREVIEELETQLDKKCKIENDLRQNLAGLTESINAHERIHIAMGEASNKPKNVQINGESMEQVENLKEQLASQSQEIEQMSQNQTLLHELRGQIHFLEAKVEQHARRLEGMHLHSSPPNSDDPTSPSSHGDDSPLQMPCEEMSPRTTHWLEMRRLEEKIGRLVQLDEELLKRAREAEGQLRRVRGQHSELQHENAALQERLSEQLVQISVLRSHMDEEKHRCNTPQKSQAASEKIEQLHEAFEQQLEHNKKLESEMQEMQGDLYVLKEEIQKRDSLIAMLQKNLDAFEKAKQRNTDPSNKHAAAPFDSNEPPACFKFLLLEKNEEVFSLNQEIEHLRNELEELKKNQKDSLLHSKELEKNVKIEEELAKENAELKEEVDRLNAELVQLNESLANAMEQVESEQAQVETLCEEMANLSQNSKRLEQDFNTVQEMMQQKERELETLHEETDAQMRLEAELEALVKELDEERATQEDLKQIMRQMEMNFQGSKKDLELQIEQWKSKFEDLRKSHSAEVSDLRNRIKLLCKKLKSGEKEDVDISEVQKQILEASSSFGANDAEAFGSLVYNLVKNAVDAKLNQMAKRHEDYVHEINETWEQKIKTELNNKHQFKKHCEKLEKENLLLRENFSEQNQRLSSEKDAHWQAKLKDIENSAKLELKRMYENEIANLKHSLEKERSAAEAKASTLSRQIKDLKKKSQVQKNEMTKEFENKIASMEHELKERREAEMTQKQEVERLREDLQSQLQKKKSVEERHREEISNLHKIFEARWFNEMKKIQVIQIEEFEKLKDSKEKTIEALYKNLFGQCEEKLKFIQDQYAQQHAEEQSQTTLRHQAELRDLQQSLKERFEKEKQQLTEMKDKETKRITDSLEKRYSKKLSELKRSASSSSERKSSSEEEERLQIMAAHKKEVCNLRRELEVMQAQVKAHETQRKRLEEAYLQQVEKVNELMREIRLKASHTCHSDFGSNRTATPSSEVTSSDEACSSCQEDMLPGNKHLLVRKIHQDGKRVLSLIESAQVPTSTEREARLWLEERKWIIYKIKSLTPEIVENQANLKLVISNLVEELLNARQRLILSHAEVSNTKERCSEMEEHLNNERSKLFILANNLSHQTEMFKEYESQLDLRSNEVLELKKILANENRSSYLNSTEKASPRLASENLTSSYDVGCLRSADAPRSAERFSMFLPEIGSPSSYKITEEVQVPQDITPLPQFTSETNYPDAPTSPDNVFYESKNISSMKEELMESLRDAENNPSYHAKLHGLYWVYKRSLSYNKSLIYQKNYLLYLLMGFQATEKITLTWLGYLNNDLSRSQGNDNKLIVEDRPKGCSLFRSAGFVVVAIVRLRCLVKRWRLRAKIPSATLVEDEVRGVFMNQEPGDCHLSSLSLSSKSTSIDGGEAISNSPIFINSRSDSKSNGKLANADTPLADYVHRLKVLQKQLGLDQNFT